MTKSGWVYRCVECSLYYIYSFRNALTTFDVRKKYKKNASKLFVIDSQDQRGETWIIYKLHALK